MTLYQWCRESPHRPCGSGATQLYKILKFVVGSFILDSIIQTAGGVLRCLGVTALKIIVEPSFIKFQVTPNQLSALLLSAFIRWTDSKYSDQTFSWSPPVSPGKMLVQYLKLCHSCFLPYPIMSQLLLVISSYVTVASCHIQFSLSP